SIYLPAILSLMPFPLKVPPQESKSSSLGTKKFQERNCCWNSYLLRNQHDRRAVDYTPEST
ncbi:hypothetical protein, partial [Porphyromonas asaccharolytica]|uniref:hypothetical protein n=1 Tax=Porphyromonas asaccharolytica TaxID=28123 RepID=UPI00248E97B8